jgi:hypothetical protein
LSAGAEGASGMFSLAGAGGVGKEETVIKKPCEDTANKGFRPSPPCNILEKYYKANGQISLVLEYSNVRILSLSEKTFWRRIISMFNFEQAGATQKLR